jgi:hypothetical protein
MSNDTVIVSALTVSGAREKPYVAPSVAKDNKRINLIFLESITIEPLHRHRYRQVTIAFTNLVD